MSCSLGKREQGEKAVAVEASEQEDRLCDFIDIELSYIYTIIERQ